MARKTTILLLEKEKPLARLIALTLNQPWLDLQPTPSIDEALRFLDDASVGAMIVDIGANGEELDQLPLLTAKSSAPMLLLTTDDREATRIRAEGLGADILREPFDPEDLRKRAQLLVEGQSDWPIPVGQGNVDVVRRRVTCEGRSICLTDFEWRLLEELAVHRGQCVSEETLLARVWGPDYASESDYLGLYIRRLRAKLGDTDGCGIREYVCGYGLASTSSCCSSGPSIEQLVCV